MLSLTYKKIVFLTLTALIALLAACTPTGGSAEPSVDDSTQVYLEVVDVFIMESFPVKVAVNVRGNLADGCVVLDGISAEREGMTFTLTIDSHREGDGCTLALVPFEESVSLDVAGLAAGTYKVVVDELSTEFTLEIDNVIVSGVESAEESIITLQRTACFGTCPIYTITIYGDGRIIYNGDDFVEATGEQTAQISPEQVQELVEFMTNGGYQTLQDEYTNFNVTDMPSAITSLTMNGETKRIEHYFGDESAPLILHQIENRIDLLANSSQWTGQNPDEMSRGVVFGQIVVRGVDGEVALPEGVVVTVRLEDVSLQDAPSVIIAEKVYSDQTQLPGFYDITFNLNDLDANGMYTVSADVTSIDGEPVYWTDTAYPVLTFGVGRSVDIEVVPVN